jgi:hypothetical protein
MGGSSFPEEVLLFVEDPIILDPPLFGSAMRELIVMSMILPLAGTLRIMCSRKVRILDMQTSSWSSFVFNEVVRWFIMNHVVFSLVKVSSVGIVICPKNWHLEDPLDLRRILVVPPLHP